MTTPDTEKKKLRLHVVMFREGEHWVGECVELGIVTSGFDLDAVFSEACQMCLAQVEYAVQYDEGCKSLFRPANPELMQKMAEASREDGVELEVHGALAQPTEIVVNKCVANAA